MIKVYGCSDDLVEIEGSVYKEDEIGCFDKDTEIEFTDGTVIRIGYPKKDLAVWWIKIERRGAAKQTLTICEDEDAKTYSDIFEIDAEIKGHSVLKQKHFDWSGG